MDYSLQELKLLEDIEKFKAGARRRRELHDDPVGAWELEELAEKATQELEALRCAKH